jgi:hypothetical protein
LVSSGDLGAGVALLLVFELPFEVLRTAARSFFG